MIVLNGGYSVGKDRYPPLIIDHKDPKWSSADDVYRFMSRFNEERFVLFVSGVLNKLCSPSNRRKSGTILVDSTAITLDLNWFRRTFTKTKLLSRDFDWGYSHVHGDYIGYKLTMAVDFILP